ncbi:MAG: hypothetical protein IIB14_07810, partial [Chloroflexi bacterium]|nr:hypothetical protein [Chloroflexota bacterium]
RLRDGKLFLMTDDTAIDGELAEGVKVRVHAVELNGDLIAVKVVVRESVVDAGVKVEFDAVISEIHGDRLILDDGRVVILTEDTDIDGDLEEGVAVEILARRFADGRIVAIEIEVD